MCDCRYINFWVDWLLIYLLSPNEDQITSVLAFGPQTAQGNAISKKKNGVRVEMKSYNLKEVDGLRNTFAYLDPPINLVDEASTHSCIGVEIKTSLLYMIKHRWISDIGIQNLICSKVILLWYLRITLQQRSTQ